MLRASNNTTTTIGTLWGINIIKYTLATTIVDECNNEDTGVGLSIATGNQYCHKYSELLHKIANTTSKLKFSPFINNIPKKTKSPQRLYIIADIAPLFAIGRIQYLIKHIDMTPIPSQPTNITTPKLVNIKIIKPKNNTFNNLKFSLDTSPLI